MDILTALICVTLVVLVVLSFIVISARSVAHVALVRAMSNDTAFTAMRASGDAWSKRVAALEIKSCPACDGMLAAATAWQRAIIHQDGARNHPIGDPARSAVFCWDCREVHNPMLPCRPEARLAQLARERNSP